MIFLSDDSLTRFSYVSVYLATQLLIAHNWFERHVPIVQSRVKSNSKMSDFMYMRLLRSKHVVCRTIYIAHGQRSKIVPAWLTLIITEFCSRFVHEESMR